MNLDTRKDFEDMAMIIAAETGDIIKLGDRIWVPKLANAMRKMHEELEEFRKGIEEKIDIQE